MSRNDNARRNAFNERVFHIGAGFKEREHPHVIETLSGPGRIWEGGIPPMWPWKSRYRIAAALSNATDRASLNISDRTGLGERTSVPVLSVLSAEQKLPLTPEIIPCEVRSGETPARFRAR